MKRKFFTAIITVTLILTFFTGMVAYAAYAYGPTYTDSVSTVASQSLGKHPHNRRNIGASSINVTTSSATPQSYRLELYTRTWGIYSKFGANVACKTSGVGGSYYWDNSNPDIISNKYAYIKVVKETAGLAELGGNIKSTSRTWK